MNLYTLLAAGFPADLDACCIETHDRRYYTWRDIERKPYYYAQPDPWKDGYVDPR